MKTAFITGISGQDGSYLSELLLKKDYQVIGMVSPKNDYGLANIEHVKDQIIFESGDLLDKTAMEEIIETYKPDEVYNLAGITFIPTAWEKPSLGFDVNANGLVRLAEIIRDISPSSKLFQASSAKMYGNPRNEMITEDTPYAPVDPYGTSKLAAHLVVKQFREKYNLFLTSGILFNHESERRGPEFVTRKITQGAVKIKLGLEKKLILGDLKAKVDWGYCPDYVEAMWLMLQQDKADDYVIATGENHSVEEFVKEAFQVVGISNWQKYVKISKAFIRPAEVDFLIGDSSKARKVLGWKPKVNFGQLVKMMVEEDIKLLHKNSK